MAEILKRQISNLSDITKLEELSHKIDVFYSFDKITQEEYSMLQEDLKLKRNELQGA